MDDKSKCRGEPVNCDPVANMKIKNAFELLNTLAARASQDEAGGYQIGGIRYGDLAASSIGLGEVLCGVSDCQHKVDHKLADILKLEAGSLDRIRKMLGGWLQRMEDTNWEVTGSGGPDGLTLSDLRVAAENLRKVETAIRSDPQPADPVANKSLMKDEIQLANWLLRDPTSGERLVFASVPVNEGSFSHVRMRSESGEDWTLTVRLKQGWLTAEQRAANFWDSVKAEKEGQPAEPVKVPSDDEIVELRSEYDWRTPQGNIRFARALLARYCQPAQPAASAELPVTEQE